MITIIAGSRKGVTYFDVEKAIKECGWEVTQVIEGGAAGADSFGYLWARNNSVAHIAMPADWKKHGLSAGYRRNVDMADAAQALIAVRVGGAKSKGTTHMIAIARNKGLRIHVLEK